MGDRTGGFVRSGGGGGTLLVFGGGGCNCCGARPLMFGYF
jgi:hypothetical protein